MQSLSKSDESDDSFYSCKTNDSFRTSNRNKRDKISLGDEEDDSEIQILSPIENLSEAMSSKKESSSNKSSGRGGSEKCWGEKKVLSSLSSANRNNVKPKKRMGSSSVKTALPNSSPAELLNLLMDGTEESAKKFLQSLYPDTPTENFYRHSSNPRKTKLDKSVDKAVVSSDDDKEKTDPNLALSSSQLPKYSSPLSKNHLNESSSDDDDLFEKYDERVSSSGNESDDDDGSEFEPSEEDDDGGSDISYFSESSNNGDGVDEDYDQEYASDDVKKRPKAIKKEKEEKEEEDDPNIFHDYGNSNLLPLYVMTSAEKPPKSFGRMNLLVTLQSTPSTVKNKEVQRYQECDDSYFLRSLSPQMPESIKKRHPDALIFVNSFKRNRKALVTKLYHIYNEKIFKSKLPTDLSISWNRRLRSTAGKCLMRKGTAVVEISDKICDSADRVRDTLVHELCHAAVWLVDGCWTDKHGPLWQTWARQCSLIFPCLPIIERCHRYDIRTKYTYKCRGCDQQIHRHSKSLNTDRKICGRCKGQFVLFLNKKTNNNTKASDSSPRTAKAPPKFALVVKENYTAKAEGTAWNSVDAIKTSHKDVIQTLSQQFKLLNLPNLESFSSTSSSAAASSSSTN